MKKLLVALFAFVLLITLSLSQVGCAIKHEVDPIEVKPIEVRFNLDMDLLRGYYNDLCLAEYEDVYLQSFSDPDDPDIVTEEEFVEQCGDDKVAEFMIAFSTAVTKVTKEIE